MATAGTASIFRIDTTGETENDARTANQIIEFNVKGSIWITSTAYSIDDIVYHNNSHYRCILGHTSSASDEPGVGGSWTTYWVTPAGNPDDQSSITNIEVAYVSDMSVHPNPDRHLSLIQDGKLGTIEVIVRGMFSTPDTATGINRFQSWMTADKTNASLPYGRFGIRYDNMSQFDLVPTATTAYYLYDFRIINVDEFQAKATFEARFYKNGTA